MSLLVVEIGSEEIPARFIPPALDAVKSRMESLFEQEHVSWAGIETFGTPRRLAVKIDGLPDRQPDREKEVVGPSRSAAFDAGGNPTRAAEGFARAQGVAVESLVVRTLSKGDYVAAVQRLEGEAVRDVLARRLPELIETIPFPKRMRWGEGHVAFARPVHWILALLDGEVIPFQAAGIQSGRSTRGHRFLSPDPFPLRHASEYPAALAPRHVIPDRTERRRRVTVQVEALAAEAGGVVENDPALIETVTDLTEFPVAVRASFDASFLNLPPEVIVSVLREHQKNFAVRDAAGRLLPHFIGISNTPATSMDTVRAGYERVVRARLSDARFYFDEDGKKPLSSYAGKLSGIVFQADLGTMAEKTARVALLTEWLAESLKDKVDPAAVEAARRAAVLCKADLVTGVVGEFPALQGVMGRVYALRSGESEGAARAIEEHYLPRNAGDRLPETDAGALVAVADRLDTIAGCFSAGLVPTGSEDPFALRRQGNGIVQILLARKWDISFRDLCGTAAGILVRSVRAESPALVSSLVSFLAGRLASLLEQDGHRPDTVEAVGAVGVDNPVDFMLRVTALTVVRGGEDFPSLSVAMKRVGNILPEKPSANVDRARLTLDAEKELYAAFLRLKGVIGLHIDRREYREALIQIARFRPSVDRFFNEVFVMDKDPEVRDNRLALLAEIARLFGRIADFSRLVFEGENR
ncbi:MAG: glycine--tRNA ligase subunit beta [Nitrospirae bacterium RBG_16_64_22]|nr:MAG: glycine--tRNA ligase subunit beta [Nitrospirae bacterium RBG_16_64_22]